MSFVVGDAAAAAGGGGGGAGGSARVVLCWVDASGRWPTKGFFGTISRQLGDAPRAAYEAAHAQGDLAEGDAHLVDCTAAAAGTHLAILVVLRRDKRAPYGTPPSLSAEALGAALPKVAAAAAARGATVHTPRLPSGSGSWYAAERLLQKHLARSQVRAFVYYFARRTS